MKRNWSKFEIWVGRSELELDGPGGGLQSRPEAELRVSWEGLAWLCLLVRTKTIQQLAAASAAPPAMPGSLKIQLQFEVEVRLCFDS